MNSVPNHMKKSLTIGYSTCPNDTFIFYALAHKLIDCGGINFNTELKDVEALNQDARLGRYEVSKLSFSAMAYLRDSYALLKSGAAIGKGCGPLIVTRPGFDLNKLSSSTIVVPGLWTTACMLLELYLAQKPQVVTMQFDHIMPAIQKGMFEAGVIIHEGRFTYPDYELVCLVDLGRWWEEKTGLPIPLGGICVRRDLPKETIKKIETAIRNSVSYSKEHPGQADQYIRHYAAEMSDSVIQNHIDLYVNDFTVNLGKTGEKAIEKLFKMAWNVGMIPEGKKPLFA
jgi:1,4-dihydroxy-6-naphthoate synthase